MQLVHFDFNSTPFELHDDNYVLKAMKLGNGPNTVCTDGGAGSSMLQPQVPLPPMSTVAHGRPPPSPPLPGILKGRVKYEH
ncbi:putative transcription factor DP, E2F-DP heterodimerization region [Helianthus anomalus]